MTTSLVLTFIGRDRPGLVNAISEKIAGAGGSWLESRLARLAEEFAGIVLISVPEADVERLSTALHGLEGLGLRITVERSRAAPCGTSYHTIELNLVGQDRPGIVRDVTQILSQLGANIEEFSSGIENAPFTGETMFRAAARLSVPDAVTSDKLRTALEALADEMMVDIAAAAVEAV
jgi:glycine cleavage system regulatory protein